MTWQIPPGPGRPKGSVNKATLEARRFCREVVESKEYRDSVYRRIANDTLDPGVEKQLQHYAWGKPPEKIEITTPNDTDRSLEDMSDRELAAYSAGISRELLKGDTDGNGHIQ